MGLKEDTERQEKFANKYKRATHDQKHDIVPDLMASIDPTKE